TAANRGTDELLVLAELVAAGRVEMRHAAVERREQCGSRFGVVALAVPAHEAHAAKTQCGYALARLAQLSCLHRGNPVDRGANNIGPSARCQESPALSFGGPKGDALNVSLNRSTGAVAVTALLLAACGDHKQAASQSDSQNAEARRAEIAALEARADRVKDSN